jgi:hypothetical protein
MMFASAGVFLPMLFDELRNLVFCSGFFEVHINYGVFDLTGNGDCSSCDSKNERNAESIFV